MTKAELIDALKEYPDNMEVMLAVNCGYEDLGGVSPYSYDIFSEDCEFEGVVNNILLKCKVTMDQIANRIELKS